MKWLIGHIVSKYALNTELEMFSFMSGQTSTSKQEIQNFGMVISLVFLLISNLINWLRLHHFLGTNNTEANKSLKTDANGAN